VKEIESQNMDLLKKANEINQYTMQNSKRKAKGTN
jgi:hypothetical protein